jgi:hypothetical protein
MNKKSLLALAFLFPAPAVAQGVHQAEPSTSPLERVAVLGASVSAGFNLEPELDAQIDLSDVLASAMLKGRQPVACAADILLFTDPLGRGPGLIAEVQAARPTSVLAIDFPFWFGYGAIPTEEQRLARFERGLEMLGLLSCPLVVGDLPDVSLALEGEGPLGGPMLVPAQIPAPETLQRLNARLREWAAQRGDVVVVPLAAYLEKVHRGTAIQLSGNPMPVEDSVHRLLQADLLHPTVEGSIAVLVLALDSFDRGREDVVREDFEWDFGAIRDRLVASTASKRQANLERAGSRVPARRPPAGVGRRA